MKLINFLLILSSLTCPKVVMQNTSKYKWVKYDYVVLKQAETRCGELYKDDICVKLFKKYDFQAYTVICGR